METKPRKKRSTIANIAGRDYVATSTLFKMFAKNVSIQTFKGMLNSLGVTPTFKNGTTHWYDLGSAREALTITEI